MEQVLFALLGWIDRNSAMDVSNMPLPALVEMAPEALTREYYGAAPHLIPMDGVDDRLQALYAPGDGDHGALYVLAPDHMDDAEHDDEPCDNPLWREIVLHELVRHVQWRTGQADTRLRQRAGEKQAYALGGTYLRQARADDPMPNRAFWAHVCSRC